MAINVADPSMVEKAIDEYDRQIDQLFAAVDEDEED